MKKLIKKNNLKILQALNENNLGSIPRMFLSCLAIVFFFYSLPIIINFTNTNLLNSDEFQNNSKAVLAYTLNKKKMELTIKIKLLMRKTY